MQILSCTLYKMNYCINCLSLLTVLCRHCTLIPSVNAVLCSRWVYYLTFDDYLTKIYFPSFLRFHLELILWAFEFQSYTLLSLLHGLVIALHYCSGTIYVLLLCQNRWEFLSTTLTHLYQSNEEHLWAVQTAFICCLPILIYNFDNICMKYRLNL